jgi:HNH endonuclease
MEMARRGKKQPIQINSVADKMKAEGQCRLCGRLNKGNGARELTRHRLVPGRLGGEYVVANVIPLCRRCHDDVEAQDPIARRMLRPKLWPMEVSHAIKRVSEEWLELIYPKPAQPGIRLNQAEILLGLREEHQATKPEPVSLEGIGARGIRKAAKKRRQKEKLVGWAWIQENPDKWYRDTATSEKALARQRLATKTATIKPA